MNQTFQLKDLEAAITQLNAPLFSQVWKVWLQQPERSQCENTKSLKWLIQGFYILGQRHKAFAFLDRVQKFTLLSALDKKFLFYKVILAEFCCRHFEKALALFRQWKQFLFDLNQNEPPLDYLMWNVLLRSRCVSLQETQEYMRKCEIWTPRQYLSHWYLFCGFLLGTQYDVVSAVSHFGAAFKLLPSHYRWLPLLGHCRQWHKSNHVKKGNLLSLVMIGKSLSPIYYHYLFDMCYIDFLICIGDIQEAQQICLEKVKQCPSLPYHEMLLACHVRQKKFTKALQFVKSEISDPDQKEKKKLLLGDIYATWQIHYLILLSQVGEKAQYNYITKVLQNSSWRKHPVFLSGVIHFYLNPTNYHFSIENAEKYFQQISKETYFGDVIVCGIRLYLLKQMLATFKFPRKVGIIKVKPWPETWFNDWLRTCKLSHANVGYYFAFFRRDYEEFPSDTITTVLEKTLDDVKTFQSLYVSAYKRLFTLHNEVSIHRQKMFREKSLFGDYYPHIPTSSSSVSISDLITKWFF